MRKLWNEKVGPDAEAVIWELELDEVRMVEAFTVIEASEHGKIPSFFLDFKVPFLNHDQYGQALLNDWFERWENEEARKPLIDAGLLPDWEGDNFKGLPPEDSRLVFLACMASFAATIHGIRGRLFLNLMPSSCQDAISFKQWITDCVDRLPPNLGIMVYDLMQNRLFDDLSERDGVISLCPQLNMQGALREIASAGDPSEPGVKFNICILNIGEALGKGDEESVHQWGKEAVKIGNGFGILSLQATGLVVYATALFQLKLFEEALELLKDAEKVAIEGKAMEDMTCKAILLQVYSMKASVYVFTKKYVDAVRCYELMVKEAEKQKNNMLGVEGYRLMAEMPLNSLSKVDRMTLLQLGYELGLKIPAETQKYSSMLLICIRLYKYAEEFKNELLRDKVDDHAQAIWGSEWLSLESDLQTEPMIKEISNPINYAAGV